MSDSNISSGSSVRRPKRCTAKQNDDNVLGISWKEERELRKAMYVSLRQQRTQQDCRAGTLRPRFVPSNRNLGHTHSVLSTTRYGRLHWRHRRRVTNNRTVAAHSSPIITRLRHSDSFAEKPKPHGNVNNGNEVRKPFSTGRSLHVRKPETGQRKTTKLNRKNVTRRQSLRNQSASQARPLTNQPIDQFYNISSSTSACSDCATNKRPTLISASNDEKVPAASSPSATSQPSPSCVRFRSPVKFAPASSKPKSSVKRLVVNSDPAISSRSPFKLPINPLTKKNRPCGLADRPFQRCLFADNATRKSPIRGPGRVVPAELCQDPMGHPVSVHDFVDFVCYRGTPYLDARLQWFDLPHSLRSSAAAPEKPSSLNHQILKSDGPLMDLSSDTGEPRMQRTSPKTSPVPSPNPLVRINTRSAQKSTAICIAKKLASVDQPSARLSTRLGNSSGL